MHSLYNVGVIGVVRFFFADDIKIFKTITSKDDSLNLQADIDALEKWANAWGMEVNRQKCHILTLGKFENTKHEIEHGCSEKHLGKTVDSELIFDEHITNKVTNGTVGLMCRIFSYLDPSSFKDLVCAFV